VISLFKSIEEIDPEKNEIDAEIVERVTNTLRTQLDASGR